MRVIARESGQSSNHNIHDGVAKEKYYAAEYWIIRFRG
jgi:hypothetical protein